MKTTHPFRLILSLALIAGAARAAVTVSVQADNPITFNVGAGQVGDQNETFTLTGTYSGSGATQTTFNLISGSSYITASPSSGTIMGGQVRTITVRVDATDLGINGSPYTTGILVVIGGGAQSFTVNIKVNVTGTDITLTPNGFPVTLETGRQTTITSRIQVANNGSTTANFDSTVPWLIPPSSPRNLNSSFDLQLNVNAAALAASPNAYNGSVVVSYAGSGSPFLRRIVNVSLTVQPPFVITSDRSSVSLSADRGGAAATANVEIRATGQGSQALGVSISGNTPWLTFTRSAPSITAGGSPVIVQLSAAPGTMNAGDYQGKAVVQAGSASVEIQVNFRVNAASGPVITSVTGVGGSADVAPNGWTAIKGTGLAPSSLTSNVVWSTAPEFAEHRMPTEIGGVRVTVNGRPAFIYFVSSGQVNVLLPLDIAPGQAVFVLTHSGTSSPPFTVNAVASAPGLPNVVGTSYILAVHNNGALVGPTSISSPGYPFYPAAPGESVAIYAFGFGLPENSLVNGADNQFGRLPQNPQFLIGGLAAAVEFAGVVSPGLYQFNIIIPLSVQTGDNTVTCFYRVACGLDGSRISVQR